MTDNISRSLSDAKVRNAKPGAKPVKITDGGGLYLLVQPTGAKLWRYKYRVEGTEGVLALGQYPDVTLADARREHAAARALVAADINPVRKRQAEREKAAQLALQARAGAFPTAVDCWKQATASRLAPLTIRQRNREIEKYLLPEFKAKTVTQITRADVARMLKRVEARAPEVARNLRNYMTGIFEHAIGMGMLDASPVPPPRIMQRRSQVSHAAMDTARLPSFLRDLEGCGANEETKIALQLVILGTLRKCEVCFASWDEFDLAAGEWVIPAERMKARREHWVPLTRQMLALVHRLRETSTGEYLFPNRDSVGRPMSDRTLNALLERIGYKGETVHGFRSVFSTHFNQSGANPDVVERCLAHAAKDKVRAAYNRHEYKDERRAMLQSWADWLDDVKIQQQKIAEVA